jgi:thymidylate kinase
MEFHGKVREGYLQLLARHPGRILRIDGSQPADEVFRRIRESVSARFGW